MTYRSPNYMRDLLQIYQPVSDIITLGDQRLVLPRTCLNSSQTNALSLWNCIPHVQENNVFTVCM